MRTVRRLYIYLVTLISLELVVWGLINLLRTSLSAAPRSATNLLASGLSLVLVGLPFFLLHGWIAQREAGRDPEELTSRLRALFHYGTRLALLSPVVLDLYNLVKEPLKALFQVLISSASYTAPTPVDRLISIVINLAAWAIFERLLRADWCAVPSGEALIEVRRLSRYVWMLYGLVLAVAGVFQTLQYLLGPGADRALSGPAAAPRLVTGLALILVGVPVWVAWWNHIQRTRDLPSERPSFLRWVVLFGVALISALVVFFAAQWALQMVLQSLLGEALSFNALFQRIFEQVDLVITFGVLWAYFGAQVRQEWTAEKDDLVQAGLRRLYVYPLAVVGNAAVFAGCWKVLGVMVELLVSAHSWGPTLRGDLAMGTALLLVGLPYWLAAWPRMQAEAGALSGGGDHARRSVLRKIYLYLAVFSTVIGLMSAAGVLFYRLINAALGSPGLNLALEVWQQVSLVALLAVWLGYHFTALRADGRLAQRTLVERQAAFALLVVPSGVPAFETAFAEALHRQAPGLPVTVYDPADAQPLPEPASIQALVLPAALALTPPASLQPWLSAFTGSRVVVPLPAAGWVWAVQPGRLPRDLALDTALLLRQLAEGQRPRSAAPSNPWLIAGYVLGAVFGLILALVLFSIFASGI